MSKNNGTNPMRELKISKVTVNMSIGEAGEKLIKAEALLESLTGQKPKRTLAKSTIQPFGIRKGQPIGVKVTMCGKNKEEFLKKALDALDFKLNKSCFDEHGNFSLGIKEHINLPGVRYDPSVGIYGMDVCATVERPGYRIKRRKIASRKIGKKHAVTKDESLEFIKSKFNVTFEEEGEEHE